MSLQTVTSTQRSLGTFSLHANLLLANPSLKNMAGDGIRVKTATMGWVGSVSAGEKTERGQPQIWLRGSDV